jgi:hypothetical protein
VQPDFFVGWTPVGGFNFGGGNGQLHLATMEFDWACG